MKKLTNENLSIAFLIMVVIGILAIAYFVPFPLLPHENYIEGTVTDIETHTVSSGFFGSQTEWLFEIDNTTIIRATTYAYPHFVDVGDQVNITLYSINSNRAKQIIVIQEVK